MIGIFGAVFSDLSSFDLTRCVYLSKSHLALVYYKQVTVYSLKGFLRGVTKFRSNRTEISLPQSHDDGCGAISNGVLFLKMVGSPETVLAIRIADQKIERLTCQSEDPCREEPKIVGTRYFGKAGLICSGFYDCYWDL